MATYKDHSIIGSGGFGEVRRVVRDDGQEFARKVLNDGSDDGLKRFQREVRILCKLDHPRIIRVIDQSVVSPPYSYVMPIYSSSLRNELADLLADETRIAKIFSSILDGMHYAHQQGVIHRDLKPENVLLNNDDDLVISDFGLGRALDANTTRATPAGQGLGTYGYAAPEQVDAAKDADFRSDIYALGRMLYEMYSGDSMIATPDLSSLPIGVARIVDRCTKKDPDMRFQSVDDLRIAFEAFSARRVDVIGSERTRELAAKAITEGYLAEEDLSELAVLIIRYQEDVDLLHDVGMQLPTGVVKSLVNAHDAAVEVLIRVFAAHVTSQSWGFEYTDKIADVTASLYSAIPSPNLRAVLINAVIEVGIGHNRYHVMDVAAGIIARISDDIEARVVAHELLNNQYGLGLIASRLTSSKLRPALKELFETEDI